MDGGRPERLCIVYVAESRSGRVTCLLGLAGYSGRGGVGLTLWGSRTGVVSGATSCAAGRPRWL